MNTDSRIFRPLLKARIFTVAVQLSIYMIASANERTFPLSWENLKLHRGRYSESVNLGGISDDSVFLELMCNIKPLTLVIIRKAY